MIIVILSSLLFGFNSIPEEILKNFPTLNQMDVLELGDGSLKKALESSCKSYSVNGVESNRAYDLVISSTLDELSYLSIPNGCVVIPEATPVASLNALKQMGKNGKLVATREGQLVIWRSTIDNGLNAPPQKNNRLTFEYSGGRLGDCLLAYLHCKWVSMKTGIPIYLKPFYQCDRFALLNLESLSIPFRTKKVMLPSLAFLRPGVEKITYMIPYFPDDVQEYKTYQRQFGACYFYLDWQDPLFKQEIRRCLAPTFDVKLLKKPQGAKSVAIHLRTGGLYEPYEVGHHYYPLKFAPFEFYVESLKKIVDFYPEEPLYVYLFTDDADPKKWVQQLKTHFPQPNIIFDCCKLETLFDDFFALSTFDCIIRGMSNFSIVAGFYGDPELIFAATKSDPLQGKAKITETTIFYQFGP